MIWKRGLMPLVLCGLLLSASLVVAGGIRMVGKRADAQDDLHRLEYCMQILGKIQEVRSRPELVLTRTVQTTELTQRIEQAAISVGIDTSEQLIRIVPRPARSIGETTFYAKSTEVVLDQITIGQLISFLYRVRTTMNPATHPALHFSQLRLQAPHDDHLGNRWLIEATLTYFGQSTLDTEAEMSSRGNLQS